MTVETLFLIGFSLNKNKLSFRFVYWVHTDKKSLEIYICHLCAPADSISISRSPNQSQNSPRIVPDLNSIFSHNYDGFCRQIHFLSHPEPFCRTQTACVERHMNRNLIFNEWNSSYRYSNIDCKHLHLTLHWNAFILNRNFFLRLYSHAIEHTAQGTYEPIDMKLAMNDHSNRTTIQ